LEYPRGSAAVVLSVYEGFQIFYEGFQIGSEIVSDLMRGHLRGHPRVAFFSFLLFIRF